MGNQFRLEQYIIVNVCLSVKFSLNANPHQAQERIFKDQTRKFVLIS